MKTERLNRQIGFVMEADREKGITRQTYLADGSRKENDAEHAYHLALMAWLLAEYANEPVDREKAMLTALIHDLVEIDAGDTYAYDDAANATKAERETRAAGRIFSILPEDQAEALRTLWEEFEQGSTPEARFVAALDRVQPVLLTDRADGKSWKEHGVEADWVRKRNERTKAGSDVLYALVMDLIDRNQAKGNLT